MLTAAELKGRDHERRGRHRSSSRPDSQGRLVGSADRPLLGRPDAAQAGKSRCTQPPARGRRRHDSSPATVRLTGSRATATVQARSAAIRRIPWLDSTALVVRDVVDEETGVPARSHHAHPATPDRAGCLTTGTRCCLRRSWNLSAPRVGRRGKRAAKNYTNLMPHSAGHRGLPILQTTRDEYVIRAIRQRHGCRRRRADRVLEGRSRTRSA